MLEGGLDWKEMGYSPKEMDFIEAKNGAAREIALAFGVPPMLLGIPGDNTYANYAEANRCLLAADRGAAGQPGGRGHDLASSAGGLRLGHDLDQVEALSQDREALWSRIGAASFLTDAEKRAAVGYGEKANGE